MLYAGKAWYMTSSHHKDYVAYEMQVFDPATLASVKNGALDAWKLRPTSMWEVTNNFLTTGDSLGATFDPVSNKLFVAVYNQIGMNQLGTEPEAQTRVYQYSVAA